VRMYGGTIGMRLESSGDCGDALDEVRPMSGWWVYELSGDRAKSTVPNGKFNMTNIKEYQVLVDA
jgi:hypothetical protein